MKTLGSHKWTIKDGLEYFEGGAEIITGTFDS